LKADNNGVTPAADCSTFLLAVEGNMAIIKATKYERAFFCMMH